ncbi:MAG: sulfatase-like hydrolase/transferase [Anaerolineae bacterium]|nr:sulfatase-like hydrolase/transferase [Anaerolineae bacterium]
MSNTRPNILCIVTDQQRADHLGCTGNSVLRTPHIDRLAATGVRFTRAYVNNPLCMPGRATLFTGQTPRGHGVRTNGIPLSPSLPTIVHTLAACGYRTHAVGKLHLTCFSPQSGQGVSSLDPQAYAESWLLWERGRTSGLPAPYYGFQTVEFVGGHGSYLWGHYARWLEAHHPGALDLYRPEKALRPPTGADQSWVSAIPPEWHHSTWIADRSIAFLEQEGRGQPFFLWCSFPDPHHPFCPPEPYASRYDPATIPLPIRRDGEFDDLPPHHRRMYQEGVVTSGRRAPCHMPDAHMQEIIAHTYGMIALIDEQVGRILGCLDTLGLRDRTVVVFLSDHGDLMGDHGLLNKGPFHYEGLLRVPLIWSWPGHFPAGRATSGLASLLDFAPTLLELCALSIPEGPVPPTPEAPEMLPPWPGVSLLRVLTGETESVREAVVVENDEDYLGLRLRTLVTDRYKLTMYAGETYGELYDLSEDPHELYNRWRYPAYGAVRDALLLRLLHELVRTDSVLPRRLSHA